MSTKLNTALITGSSKGIGAAISQRLLQQSYRVLGLARQHPENLQAQENYVTCPVDLAKLEALPQTYRQIRTQLAQLDVLICNAGFGRFGAIEQFSAAQIRELIDVNLTSHLLLLREFVPLLKRQKSGRIIIIGSEAAVQGGKNGAVYSASKFALRGVAQSLREECSSAGVSVTLINPGMVKTGFFDELNFRPADHSDCHLLDDDVATAVLDVLASRQGINIDEVNLSPQKKVIDFRKGE